MNVQVSKWGNSLAFRIPGAVAKDLGIEVGSSVDLQIVEGTLVVRPVSANPFKYSLAELVRNITPENVHEETSWGGTVGREEW